MATRSNGGEGGVLLGALIGSAFVTILGAVGFIGTTIITSGGKQKGNAINTIGNFVMMDDPDEGKPYWPFIKEFSDDINKRVSEFDSHNDPRDFKVLQKYMSGERDKVIDTSQDIFETIKNRHIREFYINAIKRSTNLAHVRAIVIPAAIVGYKKALILQLDKDNDAFNTKVDTVITELKFKLGHQTSGGSAILGELSQEGQRYRRSFNKYGGTTDKLTPGRERLELHLLGELYNAAVKFIKSEKAMSDNVSSKPAHDAKLDALAGNIKAAYKNFEWKHGYQQQGGQRQQ